METARSQAVTKACRTKEQREGHSGAELSLAPATMNFYSNHGTDWIEPITRGLYAEVALIEEQHVTHYESLLDPLDTWLKQYVLHEYNEADLY
jgi:hypothetical protein